MALTKNLTVACLAVLLLAGCSGFPVASNWKPFTIERRASTPVAILLAAAT